MFPAFIENIRERLKQPLPGEEAQLIMAPSFRRPLSFYTKELPKARTSSVLILLYPDKENIQTLLIQRAEYNGVHSAQMGFPGGKHDPRDKSLLQTALREAYEEVGVQIAPENLLGTLSPVYIPVSGFIVTPYLAFLERKPVFIPDPREVAALLETEIFYFLNEKIKMRKSIRINDSFSFTAPYYDVHGHHVWGATAMMISEAMALIKSFKSLP